MPMLIDELRERILQEYDVDLLCEVLDITSEDILDAFEHRFIDKQELFRELEDLYVED